MTDLLNAQNKFLARFERWQGKETASETASRDAMSSAGGRAHLYRRGLSQRERYDGPRRVWDQKLNAILHDYCEMAERDEPVALERFRADCDDLKRHMNGECAKYFWSKEDKNYAPGFRLAHAQKSLELPPLNRTPHQR